MKLNLIVYLFAKNVNKYLKGEPNYFDLEK